jgi:hypothetical protein
MFAPWVDPQHPDYPAKPGELRWYITDAGTDYAVPSAGDYLIVDGDPVLVESDPEALTALSRTFIPSKLADNPYLMRDKQYKAQQDALPPHLRAAIRDGNFTATRSDHELQMIPGEWIRAAQERWKRNPHPPAGIPMCGIAVDIAQGGPDNTVLQPRYDYWFAESTVIPGEKTPLGADIAGEIFKIRRNNCLITLDMGGGYGGATYEQLIQTVEPEAIYKYKGSNGTTARTQFSNMQFANTRAEAYWRLYEALDPSQPGGSQICLPPSQRLYSDLCSIRWNKNPEDNKVVQLESKKDLCARIGRSPDEGDAVVMAWYRGTKGANIQGGWKQNNRNQRPSVKLGRGANAYSRGRH